MSAPARTVLLTGASGFVGRPALDALLARGFHVYAVSRRVPRTIPTGVTWHSADLLDANARRALMVQTRPPYLVHLAWDVEHGKFWTAAENSDWLEASLDLLRLFGANGGQRALLSGSCAEYDWTRDSIEPWRETDPCRPTTPYGSAKLALFEQGTKLAEAAGFSFAWARLFLLFGLGEDQRRLIPSLIRGLLANQPVALSSGRQVRDFLDTRDAAAALAAILETNIEGPVNIGSGRALSLRQVGEMLAAIAGRSERLLRFGAIAGREGEPKSLVANISRLTNEASFAPACGVEERFAQCLEWHAQRMHES